MNDGNNLILTTHSPYLINYLTLVTKAGELKKIIKAEKQNELQKIVSLESVVNIEDLSIYELEEESGVIKPLEVYYGLPSDDNKLNEKLDEGNELFAQLLEIEQS